MALFACSINLIKLFSTTNLEKLVKNPNERNDVLQEWLLETLEYSEYPKWIEIINDVNFSMNIRPLVSSLFWIRNCKLKGLNETS
jgi:hypothetical protein